MFFASFFSKKFRFADNRCATMRGMPKAMKPVIVIILAVAVAAGAAVYMSRQPEQPAETNAAPLKADIKGGGHFRGPENAQLTLVEFGDYQCPSCAAYHPFVKEILNRYPKQLRLEFHHFPLISIHPNSFAASKAVEAAGEQGHYWEMHDAVFEYQTQWADKPDPKPIFAAIANRIGINGTILVQTMESDAIRQRILQDVERGDKAKIQAVPTFFINGQEVHIKLGMEDFVQVIEANLHK
jgi:protein-disulfide isomerase